jgi:hypothetical protein
MVTLTKYIKYQSISGDSVTSGDTVVTPISSALSISLPFFGFVWNRPSALIVESKDGTQKMPIIDLTRVAQLGLLTTGFLICALLWLIKR